MADTTRENTGAADGEMYVGYLPVPRRQRRFLRIAVPATLWLLAIAAFVIGRSQGDPGGAVWEDGRVRELTGVVRALPYPMLVCEDRGDGKPGSLLLVEVGKYGGGQRAAIADGRRAKVSGWLLHRDGRQMLELEPGDAAIRATSPATISPDLDATPVRALGRVRLQGEIVDSKCYFGAMKPGDGKTHKECATLCITGGIPPMLVTHNASGGPIFYLLMDPSGGPLEKGAYPYIGDPVEVSGDLEDAGGVMRLRIRASDIARR